MIGPLEKLIDWSAIQVMTLMIPDRTYDWRLEEALRFLKGPDFFCVDSRPAQLEFDTSENFRFPTPRPCEFMENNVVHGRLYKCSGEWREQPVIIVLPGYNDSASYNLRFPSIARRYNDAGFNVATLEPPYHFKRRPPERAEFDPGDCLFWVERAAQAISEIRALIGWLLGEGCRAVALCGFSLGAAFAGMTACVDARLAAVVMAAPPARLRPADYRLSIRPAIRRKWQNVRELCEALNLTAMNLTTTEPAIPAEKILLIEGIHDSLCLKDDIEDLWHSWGKPDIWRLPYGHVRICCGGVPGLPGRILDWLAPRLNVQHSAMGTANGLPLERAKGCRV